VNPYWLTSMNSAAPMPTRHAAWPVTAVEPGLLGQYCLRDYLAWIMVLGAEEVAEANHGPHR
jgi:hypothetical protein